MLAHLAKLQVAYKQDNHTFYAGGSDLIKTAASPLCNETDELSRTETTTDYDSGFTNLKTKC